MSKEDQQKCLFIWDLIKNSVANGICRMNINEKLRTYEIVFPAPCHCSILLEVLEHSCWSTKSFILILKKNIFYECRNPYTLSYFDIWFRQNMLMKHGSESLWLECVYCILSLFHIFGVL